MSDLREQGQTMPQGPGETQPRPTSNEQQQQHGLALVGTMQGPDMPPLQPLVLLSPGDAKMSNNNTLSVSNQAQLQFGVPFGSPARSSPRTGLDGVYALPGQAYSGGQPSRMAGFALPGQDLGLPPRPVMPVLPVDAANLPSSGPMEQDDDDEDTDSEEAKGRKGPRVKKPHLQGRFSGRLATKEDEKRLAEECKLLAPLLGGVGKRGDRSRLTLAKIVRGIAKGDIRQYLEAREEAHRILTQQLADLTGGGTGATQTLQRVQEQQQQINALRREVETKSHRIADLESALRSAQRDAQGMVTSTAHLQHAPMSIASNQLSQLSGGSLSQLAPTLAHLQSQQVQQLSVHDLAALRPLGLHPLGQISVVPSEDGGYRLATSQGLQPQHIGGLQTVTIGQGGISVGPASNESLQTGVQSVRQAETIAVPPVLPGTPGHHQAPSSAPVVLNALSSGYQVLHTNSAGLQHLNMGAGSQSRSSDDAINKDPNDPNQFSFQFTLAPGGKLHQVSEPMLQQLGALQAAQAAGQYVTISPQLLSGSGLGGGFQVLPLQTGPSNTHQGSQPN